jgi:hypothetical protein
MAHRYDRAKAIELGVMTLMNRLAAEFKEDDRRRRAGRRSWRRSLDVLDRHPSLRAVHLSGRKRR